MNDTDIHLKIYSSDCAHAVIQNHVSEYTEFIFPTYDDMIIFRAELCRLIKLYDKYILCNPYVQEVESSPDRGLAQRVLSDDPV